MIRDVLNAVQRAIASTQPPGVSPISPAPSNVGSGVISFDTSNQVLGTFNGVINFVVGGLPGVATFNISLDGGNNFDPVTYTVPAAGPFLVPLPNISPGLASPGLSGLVLDFSATFGAGDSYSFSALPSITFLVGADEVSAQDTIFPRIVFVPTADSFAGTEDYAQGRDSSTQPRSLVTDVARFEAHCWGCDYDRTELLRDTLINGIWFAVQATREFIQGEWMNNAKIAKAGNLYVLHFAVKKPVLVLPIDTLPVAPPFSANITTQVET